MTRPRFVAGDRWVGVCFAKGLIENGGFGENELRAIDRENALELLPRLKT